MPRNSFHRRYRIVTVLLALASLLFMQLAMASYSCEGSLDQIDKLKVVASMTQADMPCEEEMTADHSNLCHAHCKADPQSADKFQPPGVPKLADLVSDFPLPFVTPAPVGALLQAPLLRRTVAPPLAVRNCCFRI
jgi:hypothetical protein